LPKSALGQRVLKQEQPGLQDARQSEAERQEKALQHAELSRQESQRRALRHAGPLPEEPEPQLGQEASPQQGQDESARPWPPLPYPSFPYGRRLRQRLRHPKFAGSVYELSPHPLHQWSWSASSFL